MLQKSASYCFLPCLQLATRTRCCCCCCCCCGPAVVLPEGLDPLEDFIDPLLLVVPFTNPLFPLSSNPRNKLVVPLLPLSELGWLPLPLRPKLPSPPRLLSMLIPERKQQISLLESSLDLKGPYGDLLLVLPCCLRNFSWPLMSKY